MSALRLSHRSPRGYFFNHNDLQTCLTAKPFVVVNVEYGPLFRCLGCAACLVLSDNHDVDALLASPLERRLNGSPMTNGGWVTRLCQSAQFCAMRA